MFEKPCRTGLWGEKYQEGKIAVFDTNHLSPPILQAHPCLKYAQKDLNKTKCISSKRGQKFNISEMKIVFARNCKSFGLVKTLGFVSSGNLRKDKLN